MNKISKYVFIILLVSLSSPSKGQQATEIIDLKPDEKVWSGVVVEGDHMPFKDDYSSGFYNNQGNQIQPLLLSNKGLYVWSEKPYDFKVQNDDLIINNASGEIKTGRAGNTLKEARSYASENFFPADGQLPDRRLFEAPQYNTWIELTYDQNQEDILEYARGIVENGFPTGILMIDDTWQEDYGLWKFHPGRFSDPKAMIDQLHQMGFDVMLWVVPFVSPDQTLIVRDIMDEKGFILEGEKGKDSWESANNADIVSWWNGYSAVLDFTNPAAVKWFNNQLQRLDNKYGIDGYKFDAGDTRFYGNSISKKDVSPNEHSRLFMEFGLDYPLNEYRASWKMAGKPIVTRLRDKGHNWEDLRKLIPHMNTAQLVGYTFTSPDMIGGGAFRSFLNADTYDEELVVRSAQIHALMPMMQFSVAPWRILSDQNLQAVKRAVEIREEFKPLIMELAKESAETGRPIVSNMEYVFPNQGFANNADQFMLGDTVLVAPMVSKGHSRKVRLPDGRWEADNGKKYEGGKTYTINVSIERIPYFTKIN